MPREDAAKPEFWEKRFRGGLTPWDAGKIPAALEQFLKTEPRNQRVLIPGCGSGYEVHAFAGAGVATRPVGKSGGGHFLAPDRDNTPLKSRHSYTSYSL